MNFPPDEKVVVEVRGQKVRLDRNEMQFNENTLNTYLEREYAFIDYFGKQLEYARADLGLAEIEHDRVYNAKYDAFKSGDKCTEGQAKAKAMADPDVIDLRKKIVSLKEIVGLIDRHLRAWDRSHANVHARGHNLRKELSHLGVGSLIMEAPEDRPDGDSDASCCFEDVLGRTGSGKE